MTKRNAHSHAIARAARTLTLNSLGVTGITAGAFVLSYDALLRLALSIGFPSELAWIFPVIIDGFILMASDDAAYTVKTAGLRPWSRRLRLGYDWTLVLVATGSSAWLQVMSAPPGLLSKVGHAMPPLALLLAWEMRIHRVAGPAQPTSHSTPVGNDTDPASSFTVTRLDATQGPVGAVVAPIPPDVLAPPDATPPYQLWPQPPTGDAIDVPQEEPVAGGGTGGSDPRNSLEGMTARQRAWRVYSSWRAEGRDLTGPELQRELPEISDGYARALLRDFRTQAATTSAGRESPADISEGARS